MGTFTRRANPGGDFGAWATFEEAQNYLALSALTGKLYNDGTGKLFVPACRIGIDDGSNVGVASFPVAEEVNLAGTSNSNWIAIELSVSGSVTVLTATDIAGATDPTIIPASVRAAWSGLKGGYYLNATKRLIGLAWKDASGVLLAVVNFEGKQIYASQIGVHTGTIHEQYGPGKGFVVNIGDWNMWASGGGSGSKTVFVSFGVFLKGVGNAAALIRIDTGSDDRVHAINALNQGSGGSNIYIRYLVNNQIYLEGASGSDFDSAFYDDTSYNRGWITVHMREF